MDGEDNLNNEPAQLPNRQAVDIVEASDLFQTSDSQVILLVSVSAQNRGVHW